MTELLLNLAWLFLALPAFWLWRTRTGHFERKFGSLQCLLALGCVLVVLFPVISATDDLHAMRTEMEESSTSKRSLRQASHEKGSLWNSHMAVQPAIPSAPVQLALGAECGQVLSNPCIALPLTSVIDHAGRAPPFTSFS